MLNKDEKLIFDSYLNQLDFSQNDDYLKALKKFDLDTEQLNIPSDDIAVAKILLEKIQNRLPNSGVINESNEVVLSRNIEKKNVLGLSKIAFLPKNIFTLNWFDTAPGISWPEQYRITYVPDFDIYIVTASSDDSTFYHGVSGDIALGIADNSINKLKSIITGYWHELKSEHEQTKFIEISECGILKKEEINQWASEVWF